MGTVLASKLIGRARLLLKDRSNVAERYTDIEYLDMLNEGQLAVVRLLPFVTSKVVDHICVEGVLQTIPPDGMSYIKAHAVLPSGMALIPTSLEGLNAADPVWRGRTNTDPLTPRQVAEDGQNPYRFYVTPAGMDTVLLEYSAHPEFIDVVTDPITLNDVFQSALSYYVCYKALEGDSDNPANRELADSFFTKFNATVMGATPGVIKQ